MMLCTSVMCTGRFVCLSVMKVSRVFVIMQATIVICYMLIQHFSTNRLGGLNLLDRNIAEMGRSLFNKITFSDNKLG